MIDETRIRELFDRACKTRILAHAPYSRFFVGAALETTSGKIYTGCNVENAAYGLCICAEQVAITKAVSDGYREFQRIVVVANPVASPCGACRQVIGEFFADDAMIYSFDSDDPSQSLQWTTNELLPDRFQFGSWKR